MRAQLASGVSHVGQALREPESFAAAWNEGRVSYPVWVWLSLIATAIVGTTTYGMTMGLLGPAEQVLHKSLACTVAAGLAWGIPLPALYILNSLSGSKLPMSSTFLAAIVTTSWGGLAMVASVPINWFFSVTIPHSTFVLLVNLIVFAGVGIAMIDVFHRVMRRLEPRRETTPTWWLLVVGAIGAELFYSVGLFDFGFVSGR